MTAKEQELTLKIEQVQREIRNLNSTNTLLMQDILFMHDKIKQIEERTKPQGKTATMKFVK